MNFQKIEYFLKAAEKLNFTEAARELFITPQALTQQIAQLEEELDTKLFSRSTRKVSLTEAGLLCFQKFAPVNAAYHQALQEVTQQLAKQAGTIRAGFFHGLPKNEIVTPWLNLLQSHSPQLEIEIISADLGTIWKYLDEGRLDIILTNVDSSFQSERYELYPIVTTPAQIIVSLMHPWALKTAVSTEDLKEGDMIQLRNAYRTRSSSFYSSISCRSIHQVFDFDALLASLESGKYFAVFPPTFEYRAQAKFKYFPLPMDYAFSFSTVCGIKKSSSHRNLLELFSFIQENY